MSYLNNKLKKSIEEKIEHLFKLDDLKENKKKFDPAFTKVQNK